MSSFPALPNILPLATSTFAQIWPGHFVAYFVGIFVYYLVKELLSSTSGKMLSAKRALLNSISLAVPVALGLIAPDLLQKQFPGTPLGNVPSLMISGMVGGLAGGLTALFVSRLKKKP